MQRKFLDFDFSVRGMELSSDELKSVRPVFIIGAPRSGSTILYQYIAKCFGLGFFSNAMALAPCFATYIARLQKLTRREGVIRKSHYGFVPGVFSPNEAGALLRFFFDSALTDSHVKNVRSTFYALNNIFSSQMVSKNLYNSLRIDNIANVLPYSKFVFVQRDLIHNAQSLLLARENLYGDISKWFSVCPHELDLALYKDPYEQVLMQVVKINEFVVQSLNRANIISVSVEYEDFCAHPSRIIKRLSQSLELNPHVREDDSQFDGIKQDKYRDARHWERLCETVERLNITHLDKK